MMEPARPSVAIIHYTAPPIVGGVEAVMGEHARMLLDAGYAVRIIVGRGGTDGLPEAVDVRLIPEIDSEYPENQEVAAALDRGVVPNEFRTLRDRIESRLAEALEGIDVVIVHNVMTMHFNLPLTAALNRLLDAGRMPRTIVWTHDGSWEDPMQRKHVQPR